MPVMNRFIKNLRGIIRSDEEITLAAQNRVKNFLVVGAESSVGHDVCLKLAEEGHQIALAKADDESSLNSLAEEMMQKGAVANVTGIYDCNSEESIKNLVMGLEKQFETLDALVLLLEQPYHGDILDIKDPTPVIDCTIRSNYYAPVYFTHAALPVLRKSRGKIILLTSFFEEGQDATDALYYASRAATLAFFETLQEEESGINITIVHGPNQSPQEITSSGELKASSSKGDVDVQSSISLVWTASR